MPARVVARRPLRYRRGADPALDRPAHVRAASGLTWLGGELVVIQDDALFVGVVDPATGLVDDIAVPGAVVRTFDDARGNKRDKPDLESAIAIDGELIAFGSGGPIPARQVVLRWRPGAAPVLAPVPALFAALAAHATPAGALNLEGAAVIGDRVWFANRGGDHSGDTITCDCLLAVPVRELVAALAGGGIPREIATTHVELHGPGGATLHFADLAVDGDRLWCLAVAEDTRSFFTDGVVTGSAIGVVDLSRAVVELASIVDAGGGPLIEKLEGLAFDPACPGRAYAVSDPDDPTRPGELFELALA